MAPMASDQKRDESKDIWIDLGNVFSVEPWREQSSAAFVFTVFDCPPKRSFCLRARTE